MTEPHWNWWILLLFLTMGNCRTMEHTPSHVCIVTCDFWGLPAAGGTATAYHLLASSLADAAPGTWPVTMLGVTHQTSLCQDIKRNFSQGSVNFDCLEPHHFVPEVVNNFPYESLGAAVVRWLQSNGQHCDIVHTHEWGGGMQQLAALISIRQKANRRLIVEPHGGHYWSSQGVRQRPTDLFTLRIDDQERLTMHLADHVKSPSTYMLAHLRQRGWQLPSSSTVIANIIPMAAQSSAVRQLKRVWRLAFFGRLEERKGLKVFCEVIDMLDAAAFPDLEVMFIGGEAQIDMVPSIKYLKARTARWQMTVQIHGNLPRASALSLLRQEGVMVVFTSLVENLPFALAEACIEEIPFVTFNVGGVSELFDPDAHADVVVDVISAQALLHRLDIILRDGQMRTSVLNSAVRQSADLWHAFHAQQDVRTLPRQTISTRHRVNTVKMVHLSVKPSSSKALKRDICSTAAHGLSILLLPASYSPPTQSEMKQVELVAAQLPRLNKHRKLGAFVFGALLPSQMVSYPTSPTWLIYHGQQALCAEEIPILLLADTFCSHFLAEAGDFRTFESWVLIHHLRMAGLNTATFPAPVFTLNRFSRADSGCFADRIPSFRKLEGDFASNLMGPSEQVLITQHLAAMPRPVASLRTDFDQFQGQHGWQYIAVDDHGTEKQLLWSTAGSGSIEDGTWSCSDSPHAVVKQTTLHPCSLPTQQKCCQSETAAVGVKYTSNVWAQAALLEATFEVWPNCGDGLTLDWTMQHGDQLTLLFAQHFPAVLDSSPHRQTIEATVKLEPNDSITFQVKPGGSHDCDGVYIHDIKVWQSK